MFHLLLMKFQSEYRRDSLLHRKPRTDFEPSITVQGRAVSVRAIVDQFASGMQIDLPPGGFGSSDYALGEFDLADRVREERTIASEIKKIQSEKDAKQKAAAAAAHEAEVKAAAEKLVAEKEKQTKSAS